MPERNPPGHSRPNGGPPAASPGPAGGARPVAAFDFDGTLTTRDSFLAFLRWRAGPFGWAWGGLRLAPALLAYAITRDRGRLKSAAVRVSLRGVSRADLDRDAERFAASWSAAHLRPDALAGWAEHGRLGHLRAIVTASPEETVAPFARALGAEVLIGSRLDWTAQGRVGCGLAGANCRGAEKVRRLQAHFGPGLRLLDAYGDTAGDREMLDRAEHAHYRAFTARPRP